MQRFLQGTPATLSVAFSVGGVDTDPSPDSATVRVVRDDGTELVATTAAQNTGTGTFAYTLGVDQTALLDRLTAYWTATVGGQATTLTTIHEIVGGFLFTVGEAKALMPAATVDQITQARTRVEQAIERRVGFSFVPRYSRAVVNGDGRSPVRLKPYVRAIRSASATIAGTTTPLTPTDLANLSFASAGFLTGYCWPRGYGNVTVGYEHGLNSPDEEIRAAALDWARFSLTQDQSIDSRAERLITDDGTLVFGGGVTGLPSVDRVIDNYRLPAVA